jgi:hypothetical protein
MYRNVMGHIDRQHPSVLLGTDRTPEMVWDKLNGPQPSEPTRDRA